MTPRQRSAATIDTILRNAARWDRLGKPFAADRARAIAAKLGGAPSVPTPPPPGGAPDTQLTLTEGAQ